MSIGTRRHARRYVVLGNSVAGVAAAQEIRRHDAEGQMPVTGVANAPPVVPWATILTLMGACWLLVVARLERRQQAGRLKPWLNFMRNRYPEAQEAYDALRTLYEPELVTQWLTQRGVLGMQLLQKK